MRAVVVALVLLGPWSAACGSSGSRSDEDQIKATARAYVKAVAHDDAGDACRLTSDQAGCLGIFAGLRAAGIKPSDSP